MALRRFCLRIGYDGSSYNGFQIQKGVNSVQEELEGHLKRILGESIRVIPSGRTDSGVHAIAQAVHFDSKNPIPLEKLQHSLISALKGDIIFRQLCQVPSWFHARYHVQGKTYLYLIHESTGSFGENFRKNYQWNIHEPLKEKRVGEFLNLFKNPNNFFSFTGSLGRKEREKHPKTENLIRSIEEFRALKQGNHWLILVKSRGFGKYQVRNMIQGLFCFSTERMTLDSVKSSLEAPQRGLWGKPAPAGGLYLLKVDYPAFWE